MPFILLLLLTKLVKWDHKKVRNGEAQKISKKRRLEGFRLTAHGYPAIKEPMTADQLAVVMLQVSIIN